MSNYLAIATVTRALSDVVRASVPPNIGGSNLVATQRPTVPSDDAPHIYLYLYQVSYNAALRNADLPTRNAQGNLVGRPQVALDLHYLLAFYGDEGKLVPQRMLGAVVRDLHARPVLLRDEIIAASNNLVDDLSPPDPTRSNLEASFEQIKIAPLPLTLEELSKLWYVFLQTPYALSVVYQASVVLIDADENVPRSKPVLRRGETDRGVDTSVGPAPFLESVYIIEAKYAPLRSRLRSYPSVQLDTPGLQLTLLGGNLVGDKVELRFHHPRLKDAISLPAERSTANEITVALSNASSQDKEKLLAGLYSVDVVATKFVKDGEKVRNEVRTTNSVSLALAPRILNTNLQGKIEVVTIDNLSTIVATISIQCIPKVLSIQSVTLILEYSEVSPMSRVNAPSDTFTFQAPPQVRVEVKEDEPLDSSGLISERLRAKFSQEGLTLSAGALITVEQAGARWTIRDGNGIYHVLKLTNTQMLFVFPSSSMLYLRVDGVNSMPFHYTDKDQAGKRIDPPQLEFDETQRVTIS